MIRLGISTKVDLTGAAQELLAFVTPKGCLLRWKVMPLGVVNAPALFQELMKKIPYMLRRRLLVLELVSCGAEMEADIGDVSARSHCACPSLF